MDFDYGRYHTDMTLCLMDDIKETFIAKNADYGSSFAKSVEKWGIIAAVVRMSDKWNRMEQLITKDGECGVPAVPTESLEDTLLDLATYALMTVAALHANKEKRYMETVVDPDGVERA